MKLTVCWKWVALDGGPPDERWAGVSAADEAALEVALTMAGTGDEIVVATVGPAGAASVLREAIAVGATRVVRIDGTAVASRDVAAALARVAAGSSYVLCGDYSLDRGTGSVPAYLAAELGAAQALGLVGVDCTRHPVRGIRRLDGGRREVLDVPSPAVISVEGSVARLRRAALTASLAAKSAPIEVRAGPRRAADDAIISPYRPRARTLPAPAGDTLARVRGILDVGGTDAPHGDPVTLDPPDAARRIVDQLCDWGYLDDHHRS